MTNSRARAGPARSAMRCTPPPKGVRPTTRSTRPNWAPSAAQIMSQPSETSRPAVRQRPWTRARVGISRRSKPERSRCPAPASSLPCSESSIVGEGLDVDAAGEDLALGPEDEGAGVGVGDLVADLAHLLEGARPEEVERRIVEDRDERRRRRARSSQRDRSLGSVISIPLDLRGDPRDLVQVGAPRDPRQLQGIVLVARDHVDVEVEDGLPGGDPAGVDQVEAVRRRASPRIRAARRCAATSSAPGRRARSRSGPRLWSRGITSAWPGVAGLMSMKRDRVLVGVDDRGGRLAGDDRAEDAVGVAASEAPLRIRGRRTRARPAGGRSAAARSPTSPANWAAASSRTAAPTGSARDAEQRRRSRRRRAAAARRPRRARGDDLGEHLAGELEVGLDRLGVDPRTLRREPVGDGQQRHVERLAPGRGAGSPRSGAGGSGRSWIMKPSTR